MHGRHCRVPVGFRRLHPGEEAQRVEARAAPDTGTRRHGAQHRRDQAMDVEQRHDVEAAIHRRQIQRGADVPGAGRDICL